MTDLEQPKKRSRTVLISVLVVLFLISGFIVTGLIAWLNGVDGRPGSNSKANFIVSAAALVVTDFIGSPPPANVADRVSPFSIDGLNQAFSVYFSNNEGQPPASSDGGPATDEANETQEQIILE